MGKITICIILLFLGGLSVKADDNQPTWHEIPCTCSYKHYSDVSYPRSAIRTPKIYESTSYIILSGAQEAGYAFVTMTDSKGIDVKQCAIMVNPSQDATIYIGDLESGTYDLTINLGDYVLYGSFEIK